MGVPVVASASGGLPDAMGEAGLLVPEGDAAALATRSGGSATTSALRVSLARARPRALPQRVRDPRVRRQDRGTRSSLRPRDVKEVSADRLHLLTGASGPARCSTSIERDEPGGEDAWRAAAARRDDEGLPRALRAMTRIQPAARLPKLDFHELWQYRELAATFVWRDLKVRYKQTLIGVAWAILQPFDDDGRLHAHLRHVRQVPVAGPPVSDLPLLGHAAVDVLRIVAQSSSSGVSRSTRRS